MRKDDFIDEELEQEHELSQEQELKQEHEQQLEQKKNESKTKNGSQLTTLFISPPICGRKLPRGVMAASSLDYCEVTNTAWVM